MKYRKISAIYSLLVGLAVSGVLAALLITRPDINLQKDLQNIPFSMSMAVVSNLLTVLALLLAGAAYWLRAGWANKAFLIGMVALFCSVINAVGFYGQRGDVALLAMYDVVLVVGLVLTVFILKQMPAPLQTVELVQK